VTELLLGLDVGTSSTKAVLATPDGEPLATAEREHPLELPRPGWAEHDPDRSWWGDCVALCKELLATAQGKVAAVCCSGIGPCVLAADGRGRPLRRSILYGIATRATREIHELNDLLGADEILLRCGSPLSSQAVGPKLAWLRRNEPEVWARMRRLYMASSFLVQRLTGEYVLDHHSASQCVPLYDLQQMRWIDEWAAELAPELPLPRLLWPHEMAGRVKPEAAAETGIPAGTPVAAGTIDAWIEALSVGVSSPGDLMLMYGTTMFMIHVVADARPHPRLWLTNGVFPGTRTVAAGMATSGAVTEWFQRLVGDASHEELSAAAAAVPEGSEGLVALPYFAGERTPSSIRMRPASCWGSRSTTAADTYTGRSSNRWRPAYGTTWRRSAKRAVSRGDWSLSVAEPGRHFGFRSSPTSPERYRRFPG